MNDISVTSPYTSGSIPALTFSAKAVMMSSAVSGGNTGVESSDELDELEDSTVELDDELLDTEELLDSSLVDEETGLLGVTVELDAGELGWLVDVDVLN